MVYKKRTREEIENALVDWNSGMSREMFIGKYGFNPKSLTAYCMKKGIETKIDRCKKDKPLTDKELYVLELRQKGKTFNEIANELGFSRAYANSLEKSAYKKMQRDIAMENGEL